MTTAETEKHKKKALRLPGVPTITYMLNPPGVPTIIPVLGSPDLGKTVAEIRQCCLIAQRNLPLDIVNDLVPSEAQFPAGPNAQSMTLGRTEATKIVKIIDQSGI